MHRRSCSSIRQKMRPEQQKWLLHLHAFSPMSSIHATRACTKATLWMPQCWRVPIKRTNTNTNIPRSCSCEVHLHRQQFINLSAKLSIGKGQTFIYTIKCLLSMFSVGILFKKRGKGGGEGALIPHGRYHHDCQPVSLANRSSRRSIRFSTIRNKRLFNCCLPINRTNKNT